MASQFAAKRIGIMGGSFDPVHRAHLIIAEDAVKNLGLSEVVFIPAFIPPHKQHLQKAEAHHRVNMLQLALDKLPDFSVSELEIKRGGVSYSLDTLNELHGLKADAELVMIIGSDTLVDLHNWYKIDELLDLCEVATFMRPGENSIEKIKNKVKLAERFKEKLISNVFKSRLVDISSTEIRNRVAAGVSIHDLVPSAVETYIVKHRLYQG